MRLSCAGCVWYSTLIPVRFLFSFVPRMFCACSSLPIERNKKKKKKKSQYFVRAVVSVVEIIVGAIGWLHCPLFPSPLFLEIMQELF